MVSHEAPPSDGVRLDRAGELGLRGGYLAVPEDHHLWCTVERGEVEGGYTVDVSEDGVRW